jgi:hypothetical protein
LLSFSKRDNLKIKPIPNFTFGEVNESVQRLFARKIKGIQYLLSPDFKYCQNIDESDIDFSQVNELDGIFFDYDGKLKVWKMVNLNPYVRFKSN